MADSITILTPDAITALAGQLMQAATAPGRRHIVGIAGVPGAGKSTFATMLLDAMNDHTPGGAALIPMDGFHLSNDALRAANLVQRKGAPETFDAEAYIATLDTFRDPAQAGPFPVYDRAMHEPVTPNDDAHRVTADTRIILTEGNYLLLDAPPWRKLADVLDETWWLATPIDDAERWLTQRHLAVGRTDEQAKQRCAHDRRNAERVLDHMRSPDRVLRWPDV